MLIGIPTLNDTLLGTVLFPRPPPGTDPALDVMFQRLDAQQTLVQKSAVAATVELPRHLQASSIDVTPVTVTDLQPIFALQQSFAQRFLPASDLYIAPCSAISTIPHSFAIGRGLFTRVDIPKNRNIYFFDINGLWLTYEECLVEHLHGRGGYTLTGGLPGMYYFLWNQRDTCLASMANSSRRLKYSSGRKVGQACTTNARICWSPKYEIFYLKSTRSIKANDEIMTSYGTSFFNSTRKSLTDPDSGVTPPLGHMEATADNIDDESPTTDVPVNDTDEPVPIVQPGQPISRRSPSPISTPSVKPPPELIDLTSDTNKPSPASKPPPAYRQTKLDTFYRTRPPPTTPAAPTDPSDRPDTFPDFQPNPPPASDRANDVPNRHQDPASPIPNRHQDPASAIPNRRRTPINRNRPTIPDSQRDHELIPNQDPPEPFPPTPTYTPTLLLLDTTTAHDFSPEFATIALSSTFAPATAQYIARQLRPYYNNLQPLFDAILYNAAIQFFNAHPAMPANCLLDSSDQRPAKPFDTAPLLELFGEVRIHFIPSELPDFQFMTHDRFETLCHLFALSLYYDADSPTTVQRDIANFAFHTLGNALMYVSADQIQADLNVIRFCYFVSLYMAITPLMLRRLRTRLAAQKPSSKPPDQPQPPRPPPEPPPAPTVGSAAASNQSTTLPKSAPKSKKQLRQEKSTTRRSAFPLVPASELYIQECTAPEDFIIQDVGRVNPNQLPLNLLQNSHSALVCDLQKSYDIAGPDSTFDAPNGLQGHRLPDNSYEISAELDAISDFNSLPQEAFPIPEDPSKFDMPTFTHDDPEMTAEEFRQIQELLHLVRAIFAVDIPYEGADLPHFFLHLKPDAKFEARPFHRVAASLAAHVKEKLETLLRLGVIIRVLAFYANDLVMVLKKNAYRMCVNYKPVNVETEDLKFPIPHLPDLLQFLKGKKVFTVLDNRLGYHQLRVHKSIMQFLTFHCQFGSFTWRLCPFGPKTLPGWYTFLMSAIVFAGLMYLLLICYFDDCVIASDSYAQHIEDLKITLARYVQYRLTLKGAKCQIARKKILFHGYVITSLTIAHDPARIKQVMEIPPPNTAHKLQMYLGLINYFHSFIPGYSVIRKPLNSMITEKPYRWTPERRQAFNDLQQSVNRLPALYHIDYNRSIYLDVDASQIGFFGYLFQLSSATVPGHEADDQLRLNPDDMRFHQPLGFISKAFTGPMLKWNNTVREVFGITFCILGFKHLLQTAHFYCRTDHRNFLQMRSSDNPIVNHCLDKLIPYFVTFIFNNGFKHCIPDFGSRTIALLKELSSFPIPTLNRFQACYPTATEILTAIAPHSHRGQVPTKIWSTGDSLSHSGLIPAKILSTPTDPSPQDEVPQIINTLPPPIIRQSPPFPLIPEDRLKVIRHYHDRVHQGIDKTLFAIKKAGHYWPSLRTDVVRYVQSCPFCQLTWRIPHASYIHLDSFESYDPFYCISLDFMGPFDADPDGYTYYCVIIDVFSRYVEIFPTPDNTAESAALCLLDIYAQYTLPRIISQVIATDNAQSFLGKTFTTLLRFIGASPSYSLPYSHQTTVERVIEEVLRYTRTLLLQRRDHRDQKRRIIAKLTKKIINSSVHKDTNCAPHELIHGVLSPLDPLPLHNEAFDTPRSSKDITTDIIKTQIRLLREAQRYQAANTDIYLLPNMKNPQIIYRPGQLVTVKYPVGPPVKSRPPIMGPFQILSRSGDKYIVLDLLSNQEHEYHFRRLRLFNFADYHQVTPRDIALMNSLEFDVEDILEHRGDIRFRSTLEFKVRFKGYDETYDDWVSTNQICRHPLMPTYLQAHPELRTTVMNYRDP